MKMAKKKRRINGFMLMMEMERDFKKMKASDEYSGCAKFCKKWNVTWQEVK